MEAAHGQKAAAGAAEALRRRIRGSGQLPAEKRLTFLIIVQL